MIFFSDSVAITLDSYLKFTAINKVNSFKISYFSEKNAKY